MNNPSLLGFIGLGSFSFSLFNVLVVLACVAIMAVVALPFAKTPRHGLSAKDYMVNGEFDAEKFMNDIGDLRTQINTLLAGLPPLEQYEAASEMSYGIRGLQRMAADFVELADGFRNNVQKFTTKVKATAVLEAETALLAKGDYVKKTDATAAQEAAVTAAKLEVKTELQTEQTATAEGETRRAKLVEDKVVTATVAAAIPIEFFKADGFEDRKTKLTARLGKVAEAKLTAEAFLAEMVAIPVDEAGDKIFNARLESAKSLVSATASRPAGTSLAGLGAKKDDPELVAMF